MKIFTYSLFAVILAFGLTGCASGPALHNDPAVAPAFESLKATERATQKKRFGDLAETAGKRFVGYNSGGQLIARTFEWIIPGVVLEEQEHSPNLVRLRYQYNPLTWKLDVFYMRANNTYNHVIDLAVLPDGAVEWPLRMMGLEKPSYVTLNAKEELVRDFKGVQANEITRRVTQEKFDAALREETQRLAKAKADARRSSLNFWNGAAQVLGGTAEAVRQTREQQQMQQSQQRSALMAAQSREAARQEAEYQAQVAQRERDAKLKAQQGSATKRSQTTRSRSTQTTGTKKTVGSTSATRSTGQPTGAITIEKVSKAAAPVAPAKAKPKAASHTPEPVLEGFVGKTCAEARRYAEKFPAVVVRVEPNESGCIALARRLPPKGTASKQ